MRRSVALALAAALFFASCTAATEPISTTSTTSAPGTTSTTVPDTTTTTVPAPPQPMALLRPTAAFASGFPENPILVDEPRYAGPPTPTSLDGVLWGDMVRTRLDLNYPGALELLTSHGFVVVSTGYTQFHGAYSHVEASLRQPLFVTTDAAYHYWHLAFAKALRDTEQLVLLPALDAFALRLRPLAEEQARLLAGTPAAPAADRAASFAELLVAVLGLDSGPFSADVTAELALIRDHLDFGDSPTTGALVDYTLFRPRGHYTRNEDLTRYFLGMSVLGQTAFLVAKDDQLATAVLLSDLVVEDPSLSAAWRTLYEPTAFLVGLADDYTPVEAVAAAAAEGALAEPSRLADPSVVAAIGARLLGTRQVAIDPAISSVRVMGARFVLDSFVLDQLVYPSVQSRLMGSPLDVAAAFGSDWAYAQLESQGETNDPAYAPQMEELRAFVAGRNAENWAGTVYDAWLYALQPSWRERGAAFPDFMRTPAWTAKSHQTGFGSYTELKHDTVLYAKQAFAEGEFDQPPAEPRHWVEPDPIVYARLAAVARLMAEGLGRRNLLDEDVAALLTQLVDMYERFEQLAWDELAHRPISAEDNAWLETIGSRFELLWLLTAESEPDPWGFGGFAEGPDDLSAVIVDIMSNPWEALEIGTGLIDEIYVLVPNDDGRFQVARGGVYSYYEFLVPREERLTDEEWRGLLYERLWDRIPARPSWTEPFLVRAPWE